MLWFDDDPNTNITQKILAAARFFKSKYRTSPTQCQIRPGITKLDNIGQIQLIPNHQIQPNNFLIGTED